VQSDSGEILSDTLLTVTWDLGVPVALNPTTIELRLFNDPTRRMLQDSGTTIFVAFSTFGGLQVPLNIISSSSGISCSFAGGCPYQIEASGLASSLLGSPDNKIDFCGQECPLDVANSSVLQARCTVPALPSLYSVDNYKIKKAGPLANKGVWSGTTSEVQLAKLFDEDETTVLEDNTQSNCFF